MENDNLLQTKADETDKSTPKCKLLTFPTEILIKIFNNFDDYTLLKAGAVCKLFKSIAETTVSTKYDGTTDRNFYQIEQFYKDDEEETEKQHQPFLCSFGEQISAIALRFQYDIVQPDHWMIRLVNNYGQLVSKLQIGRTEDDPSRCQPKINLNYVLCGLLNLTSLVVLDVNVFDDHFILNEKWTHQHYEALKQFHLIDVNGLQLNEMHRFCEANKQIESFEFRCKYKTNITISILADLVNLKKLSWHTDNNSSMIQDKSIINLEHLIEVRIDSVNKNLLKYLLIVLADACKNIQYLNMGQQQFMSPFEMLDEHVDILCTLKNLINLYIGRLIFRNEQVTQLICELPNLEDIQYAFNDGQINVNDLKPIVFATKNHEHFRKIHICLNHKNGEPSFNSEFHKWFKKNATSKLLMELCTKQYLTTKKIKISTESIIKSIKNDVNQEHFTKLIHWNGNEQLNESPKLNLLNFDDKHLEKIIDQLDLSGKLALYQTCNRMRDLIGPLIRDEYQNKTFEIRSNLIETEQFLRNFGSRISKIYFDVVKCKQIEDNWNLIHKWCGQNLMELIVNNANTENMRHLNETDFSFPMLMSLTFVDSELTITDDSSLNFAFCPNLMRLEFDENTCLYEPDNLTTETIALHRLKTLQFKCYSPDVIDFLNILDDETHQSVSELSMLDGYENDNQITFSDFDLNSIGNFPNLTKLDLVFSGIERFNSKYLFERCSNLKSFSISFQYYFMSNARWTVIKDINEFCEKLEKLQLVFVDQDFKLERIFLTKARKLLPERITIEVLDAFRGYDNVISIIVTKDFLKNWKNEMEKSSLFNFI